MFIFIQFYMVQTFLYTYTNAEYLAESKRVDLRHIQHHGTKCHPSWWKIWYSLLGEWKLLFELVPENFSILRETHYDRYFEDYLNMHIVFTGGN